MNMDEYRFGVVGVGPIGGIMAAHLAKAGHNVTLIDILEDHLNAIKRNGLSISGFKELNAPFPGENICYSIDEMNKKELDVVFISVLRASAVCPRSSRSICSVCLRSSRSTCSVC